MNLGEYTQYDAMGLADLVRRGEVTPDELGGLAKRAIDAVNPTLNFLVAPIEETAPPPTEDRGPFSGVPFLIKDLGTYLANVPSENGSLLAKGVALDHDSALSRRYRASGVTFLGRTTTPEFGMSDTTESRATGITRNPWDPSLSPGGSSGGSAAAVAARAVPMAHAADGMGSIRIPAHCCGLFGLKPTRGRLPKSPGWPGLGDLSASHVLTRTVRDGAAMLDATMTSDLGAGYLLERPTRSYLEEASRDPRRLRIGLVTTPPFGSRPFAPECLAALMDGAKRAEDLGHDVFEVALDLDHLAWAEALLVMSTTMLAHGIGRLTALTKRPADGETLEPLSLACLAQGRDLKALDVSGALEQVNLVCRKMARLFEGIDVLMAPVSRDGAPPIAPPPRGDINVRQVLIESLERIQLTPLFNLTGQPAMSVPLHWTVAGLPIGVQCAAAFGDEATLFTLAGQLERAYPWIHHTPKVVAGVETP